MLPTKSVNIRPNPFKPVYKGQEDQYQEILQLRKALAEVKEEHLSYKARARQLEEELIRRDKQIEQMIDPSKNDEARRRLTDKGASVVTSLKLRVSRLETALRDKEVELTRLQSTSRATTVNELKIQTETYYQEVVRLRNQLNSLQKNGVASTCSGEEDSVATARSLRMGRTQNKRLAGAAHFKHDESSASTLRDSVSRLERENHRLGEQLCRVMIEKNKLSADLDRLFRCKSLIGNERSSEVELSPLPEENKLEIADVQEKVENVLSAIETHKKNALVEEGTQMSVNNSGESEWERERLQLHEIINMLKDDRVFYKEVALKKDSELESLRTETHSLHERLLSLQESKLAKRDNAFSVSKNRIQRGKPILSPGTQSGTSSEANSPTHRPRSANSRPGGAMKCTRSSRVPSQQKSPQEKKEISRLNPGVKKPPVWGSSSKTSSDSQLPIMRKGKNVNGNKAICAISSSKQSVTQSCSSTSSSKNVTPSSSPKRTMNNVAASPNHKRVATLTRNVSQNSPSAILSPQDSLPNSPKMSSSRSNSHDQSPLASPSRGSKLPRRTNSPSKIPSLDSPAAQMSPSSSPSDGGKILKKKPHAQSSTGSPIMKMQVSSGDEKVLAEILRCRSKDSQGDEKVLAEILQCHSEDLQGDEKVLAEILRCRSEDSQGDEKVLAEILRCRSEDSQGDEKVLAEILRCRSEDSQGDEKVLAEILRCRNEDSQGDEKVLAKILRCRSDDEQFSNYSSVENTNFQLNCSNSKDCEEKLNKKVEVSQSCKIVEQQQNPILEQIQAVLSGHVTRKKEANRSLKNGLQTKEVVEQYTNNSQENSGSRNSATFQPESNQQFLAPTIFAVLKAHIVRNSFINGVSK